MRDHVLVHGDDDGFAGAQALADVVLGATWRNTRDVTPRQLGEPELPRRLPANTFE